MKKLSEYINENYKIEKLIEVTSGNYKPNNTIAHGLSYFNVFLNKNLQNLSRDYLVKLNTNDTIKREDLIQIRTELGEFYTYNPHYFDNIKKLEILHNIMLMLEDI